MMFTHLHGLIPVKVGEKHTTYSLHTKLSMHTTLYHSQQSRWFLVLSKMMNIYFRHLTVQACLLQVELAFVLLSGSSELNCRHKVRL